MKKRNNCASAPVIETGICIVKVLDRLFTAAIVVFLSVITVFAVSSYYDMYRFTYAGIKTVEYHDFAELEAINPDTVCWLSLDGTNINHPVVQGRDNYEYLSKDFYGNDYAGGAIFLDSQCRGDLDDDYLIIHGHHMAHGAMFGDLTKYFDKDFFAKNCTGELLTRDAVYDLAVIGVSTVDAYDLDLYYAGEDRGIYPEVSDICEPYRDVDFSDGDKLLMLSTCSGDMTNARTAVFCRVRYRGENN